MNSTKKKYYAVAKGHKTGIFEDWDTVNTYINGYSGAVYKGFNIKQDAEEYLENYNKQLMIAMQNNSTNWSYNTSKIESLTHEQRYVFECLLNNKNLLITGGGGVGKSYIISTIYTELPILKRKLYQIYEERRQAGDSRHVFNMSSYKPTRIQLCAMTGCAAILLGNKAKTLHSWSGIGLGKGTVGELFVKIRKNKKAIKNWLCTDILVIDEISMLTAELLDKLDQLGRKLRANQLPFGGIQVILVGDFYQLPPVNRGDESVHFAFDAACWNELIHEIIDLTIIQRQKDETFQKILKEARIGKLSRETCDVLTSCMGRKWQNNKIRPTLIFPRRAEVEMINTMNLNALTGPRHMFKASIVYDGKAPIGFDTNDPFFKKTLEMFDSEAGYLVDLELVVDAQVILIANISPEEGLVNGSRGVISHFCPTTGLPYVEFINGIKRLIGTHTWELEEYPFVLRSQIPLRLGYAITAHRSQGSTLDSALVDLGSTNFEYGQAYVALSRVKSLDGLYVHDFDPSVFKAHSRVKQFYSHITPNTDTDTPTFNNILTVIHEETNIPDNKPIYNNIYTSHNVHVIKNE